MANHGSRGAPTRRTAIAGAVLLLLLPAPPSRGGNLAVRARPFFDGHCVTCHDADTKKGGLNLTDLSGKPLDSKSFDLWVKVFDFVETGRMPPRAEKRLDSTACGEFLNLLRAELRVANQKRQQAEGRVVLRRLNRVEYENTLHDLLAIDLPLRHYLPEDASSHGFDNVAVSLRLSMLHMEAILEAADAAVAAAIDLRRRPSGVKTRYRYHDEESVLDDAKRAGKKSFRMLPDAVVVFDDNSPTVLHRFGTRSEGDTELRSPHTLIKRRDVPSGSSCMPPISRRIGCSVTSTCPRTNPEKLR